MLVVDEEMIQKKIKFKYLFIEMSCGSRGEIVDSESSKDGKMFERYNMEE